MLGGIIKAGWQSESVEKRLQAIAAMRADDSGNQQIFAQIASQDGDAGVRQAALNKLSDPELLLQLSQSHSDAETRDDADHALSVLLRTDTQISEADLRGLLNKHPHSTTVIIQHCSHAALRAELASALSEADLSALLEGVEYTDTRQLIATRLQAQAHLEHARKVIRGKDKAAEKLIKAKLDELHAEQRLELENQQVAETICEKVEFLASHDWRPEFTAKFHVWQQRWQALQKVPSVEIVQRFELASKAVEKTVNQHLQLDESQTAQQQLVESLSQYCQQIANLDCAGVIAQQTQISEARATAQDKWVSLAEVVSPESALHKRFNLAEQSLDSAASFGAACAALDMSTESQSTLAKARTALAEFKWPKRYPEFLAASELKTTIQDLTDQNVASAVSAAEIVDKLHKRINRLLGATKRGELSRAKRELAAITKAVSRYEGKDKAALDERLGHATEAVGKMGDWKDFATEPKFVELCEAMEKLIGAKMHAEKLSAQINQLQQQWKALGFADSADTHWPRFKEAADKAYQPCAEFFKQQRANRRENLKKREPLVKRMQSLLENSNWPSDDDESETQPIDYKQIESEMQSIANAWQKIKDVERAAGQKQWNRLSKYRSAIYEKLDVVYDANIELKNQLLKQAQALAESEVNELSLGKLQLYQSKWKQVGVTRRKQDQAVWKKFKTATDDVYQQIQNIRQGKRAKEDAQLGAYRDISKQIQQLAQSATELAEADSNFERLQAEYEDLPELPIKLPEKLIKKIDSDYRRAGDAFAKARERILASARQSELDALSQKASLCAELEALATTAQEDKVALLQQAIADIQISSKELLRRFEPRLKAALDTDRAAATEHRRLLCIDVEILLGVDSPPEDAALRMKVQLERMQKQGIGHKPLQKNQALDEFKLDWLCLPGAEPEVQKELDKRFSKLVQKQK